MQRLEVSGAVRPLQWSLGVHDCVYRAKEGGLLLARVTTILPLYLHGNSTFYAPFNIHQSYSCGT